MNTTLSRDETIIKEVTFSPNLLLFWLKGHYVLTSKRLTGQRPNTLMGVIPLGKVNVSQPLKTIASVTCVSKFWFMRLLIGLVLLVFGLAGMSQGNYFFGLLFALAGVGFVLNCYTAYFDVTNNAGQNLGGEVLITAQAEIQSFANEMNQVISDL